MSVPHIAVSYNGGEKRVSLSVQPSLELSDSEVDNAAGELHKVLRNMFSVEANTAFYLHEVETGRVMSKESFREPKYCQTFPTHWYLVIDNYSTSNSTLLNADPFQCTNVSITHEPEDLSRLGEDMSSLDLEESGLADFSTPEAKYQSVTMKGQGHSGCSLRYFSIQPTASLRSDTPMDQSDSHLRSDSCGSSASGDSLDALKLSTTFVGDVSEGSLAERAGVERGFVVHMINGDSILRSNVEQMRMFLQQSGDEVTLLGLPQDNDDLQFLYSQYTNGEAGQFSTTDGFITVVDLPLILNANSASSAIATAAIPSSNGISPPIGMVPFDDSQDNSLSCDQFAVLDDKQADDILIMGSLSEIGTHEIGKWEGGRPLADGSSVGSLHQLENGNVSTDAPVTMCHDKEWYHHDEGVGHYPPAAHDQSSLSEERSIYDHLSQPETHTTQQKKKNRKSLEALTRIGSFDQEPSVENAKNWRSQSMNSSHGCPSSENSQLSGGSTRGQGLLSAQSQDEQRMSGDSVGSGQQESSLLRTTSSSSSHLTKTVSSSTTSATGKRAVRGYQSRRAELHKSRSKIGISEPVEPLPDLQQSWRERADIQDHTPINHFPSATFESTPPLHNSTSSSSIPIIRQSSVKEKSTSSLHEPPIRGRPLSAIEPHSVDADVLKVPGVKPRAHLNFTDSPLEPLFTTITALTPSGEEEVFREVSIGDAIDRSQGIILSAQDHTTNAGNSLDNTLSSRPRVGRTNLARHGSVDVGSLLSATNSDFPSAFPSSSPTADRVEIVCHGLLSIKQDMQALGKRAQDRSWRNYYAVLTGTKILFYKDKRDAVLEKSSEEPPLEVVPVTIDLEAKNTKRKFVFRLMTSNGQSYFLQADDAPSRQRWMENIQQLNAKHQTTWQGRMPQLSPQSMRRLSSPQPLKSGGGGGGGAGGSTSLFRRIKKTLMTRNRDDTDYSSFTAFGQPLQDCPVSPDNKRVPLVVEFCVGELEEHGLTVEGIYRKPGLVAMINNISSQMDKGNYMFDIADYGQDIHTIASLIKKYLKELPDPLIPSAMYKKFVECSRLTDQEARLTTLKELVFHLPTAHYHTLRYLMTHLSKVVAHSSQNKMTLRNVALVFGPTLMRSSADGDELLASMSASYTIVELLCKHSEYLCAEELCAEELAEQDKTTEQEDMSAQQGSAFQEAKAQKEQALANASPLSVRRIKNRLAPDKNIPMKRHSSAHAESLTSIPKTVNHSGSATLGHLEATRGHFHASDSNINNSPGEDKKRVVRHAYEDMEVAQRDTGGGKSNTRTMNWINDHTEMNWGRGDEEVTGSMWSSKNRVQRPHSKEKVRNGGGVRRVSKTKSDQGREALYTGPSSYNYRAMQDIRQPQARLQQPAVPQPQATRQPPPQARHQPAVPQPQTIRQPPPQARQQPAVPQPQAIRPQPQAVRAADERGHHPGAMASQQRDTLRSRRISYMSAMNDPSELPVKDTSSTSNTSRMREASSEYGLPYSNSHHTGRSYAHLYNHPPSAQSMHPRTSKYNSRDFPPPHRRISESSEPMDGYLQHRHHLQGQRPHRTFSNERTYLHSSPPTREQDDMPYTSKPHKTAQESYL